MGWRYHLPACIFYSSAPLPSALSSPPWPRCFQDEQAVGWKYMNLAWHWAGDPRSLQVLFPRPALSPVPSHMKSQTFTQIPEATGLLSLWSWVMGSSDPLIPSLGGRNHRTGDWEGSRPFSSQTTCSAGLLHADELWRRCLPWSVSL